MEQLTFGQLLQALRESRRMTRGELALRSGIKELNIISLEKRDSPRPSAENILKIARALDMTLEQTYERLGLGTIVERQVEPFTDLLELTRQAAPVAIPVYDNFNVHLGGAHDMPSDYMYFSRRSVGNKHLEAFRCEGTCMEPLINDGETIIVDVETPPSPGDIVLCLTDDGLICGHYRLVDGVPVIENGQGSHSIKECKRSAVVKSSTRYF
jgi:transcriptional regulator with XRE-family HTH domain